MSGGRGRYMSGGRGRYMSGFCARFLKAVTGGFVILKFRLCEMWRKKLQLFSLEVKTVKHFVTLFTMFYQQIFVLIKLIYKLLNGFSIAVLASVFESEISGGEGGGNLTRRVWQ